MDLEIYFTPYEMCMHASVEHIPFLQGYTILNSLKLKSYLNPESMGINFLTHPAPYLEFAWGISLFQLIGLSISKFKSPLNIFNSKEVNTWDHLP